LSISENVAEQDITKGVSVRGRGLRTGIPVVATLVARAKYKIEPFFKEMPRT
jgi:hypothetical protein